jgi:hypothetical protein
MSTITSMNDMNEEIWTSLWPNIKLIWEKLVTVGRQINANCQSSPDGACSDAIHYTEMKCGNHSCLRRDLQESPNDPLQYIGIYMFLCLLFVLFCMTRYVVEEGCAVS